MVLNLAVGIDDLSELSDRSIVTGIPVECKANITLRFLSGSML